MTTYQDTWIRGAVARLGVRDCAPRYDVIRSVVDAYRRPITVWDLGANLGYFGCRLAEEYGAVSVMVESRPALVDVCRRNDLPNAIAMTHRLSVADLRELAASEHADVVLALNVLHHFTNWRGALKAVLSLGEHVVIETPGRGDVGSVNYAISQQVLDALEALGAQPIATHPSHVTPGVCRPMFLVQRPKTAVTAGYAYGGKVRTRGPHPPRAHVITSTRVAKSITFADGEHRPWIHGLNLWNWLQMGGSYPDRASVQHAVRRAAETVSGHGDFKPWNLILQGRAVQVIDAGHRQSCDDAEGLVNTLAWVERPELAYVQ